jgi:uncharacterized protein (DUF1499 family)
MTQIKKLKPVIAMTFICGIGLTGCSSNPTAGGISQGKLADCPSSPNCVSSEASDEGHSIAPLRFTGTPDQAKTKLISVVESYPRSHIVLNDENYLHVEFTTKLMRFVDDGEFLIEEQAIQLRSKSRVGYGDLGKNRSRIEEIREAFEPCCE